MYKIKSFETREVVFVIVYFKYVILLYRYNIPRVLLGLLSDTSVTLLRDTESYTLALW